jgi:hypothetical protein
VVAEFLGASCLVAARADVVDHRESSLLIGRGVPRRAWRRGRGGGPSPSRG